MGRDHFQLKQLCNEQIKANANFSNGRTSDLTALFEVFLLAGCASRVDGFWRFLSWLGYKLINLKYVKYLCSPALA